MAAETQYTARTATVLLTTGTDFTDGTNAVSILTAGASGTLVNTVTIKAITNTNVGMIRFYDYDGTNTKLIYEVPIPAITKSATVPAFQTTVPLNYFLKNTTGVLKVTSQNGGTNDNFVITVEGFDWAYYTTSVRPESANYTANNYINTMTAGNSALDGSGANIYQVFAAAASGGSAKGTIVQSVIFKAQGDTSLGMVRLFTYDGTNKRLLREVPVPANIHAASYSAFSHKIDFGGQNFALNCGWSLYATTENSETFNVIVEGLDWQYPA